MTTHAAPRPPRHVLGTDTWLRRFAAAIDTDRARIAATVALLTALIGLTVTVGADARWLAALGRIVAVRGRIPVGVPFAAAPTGHWSNPLVLAELAFHLLEAGFGDRGLTLAQLVCVATALSIVGSDGRAARSNVGGTPGWSVPVAITLAAAGAFPALAIARVQMFSLVLFPALVLLLRAESRRPSRRIWLCLPLLALWSNLHGAVLSGAVVLALYLALDRIRHDRLTAIALLVAAPIAICLTPAGPDTLDYFRGLVTNLAAERGVGMWAPLGATPFDWVTVAAALALAFASRPWRRPHPPVWELAVAVILAGLTVKAARDGVWLLMFMVAIAARGGRARGSAAHGGRARSSALHGGRARSPAVRSWSGLVPVAAAVAAVLLVSDLARVPPRNGASARMIAAAMRDAGGGPILADALPAEQLALAGARIWAGDPLDAFSRRTQAAYLDFIDGVSGAPLRALLADQRIRVILAAPGGAAAGIAAGDRAFVEAARDATALVFVRRGDR